MEDFARKQYGAVGSCIYCGSTANLTREHIIPFGLGGTTTLLKASCSRCAKITGQVEAKVLRGSMWPARILLKLRSRRPGDAPTHEILTIIRDGAEETVQLPLEDYPVLLPMPIFEPASYLTDAPDRQGINLIGADWLNFGPPPNDVARRLGAESISYSHQEQPVEFARMIGKIAFAHAVAELGREKIEDLGLVASILGKANEIGQWVGTFKRAGEAIPGLLHRLSISIEPENIIVSQIQLLAHSSGPTYSVIVGRLRP
jgi:HNH endonuclease